MYDSHFGSLNRFDQETLLLGTTYVADIIDINHQKEFPAIELGTLEYVCVLT